MLKLYGYPKSRSLRAAWALEEARAEYDYAKVDLMKGEGRKPAFLAINPFGKVPALVDGDLVITESAAIMTYVGEKFPASGLVPIAHPARAAYFQWVAFTISELEQPLWTLAKHRFALPENLRMPAIEPTALWEFARAAGVLHQYMQGREYVAGERFSGADIMVGHTLSWARNNHIPLESPVLEAYADRILSSPSLAAARARESL
jgi:glutathione S-transferase